MIGMVLLENGSEKALGIVLESFSLSAGIVFEALFRTGTMLPLPGTGLSLKCGNRISHAKVTEAEIIPEHPSFIRIKITALPD